jgi:hypothetical protein
MDPTDPPSTLLQESGDEENQHFRGNVKERIPKLLYSLMQFKWCSPVLPIQEWNNSWHAVHVSSLIQYNPRLISNKDSGVVWLNFGNTSKFPIHATHRTKSMYKNITTSDPLLICTYWRWSNCSRNNLNRLTPTWASSSLVNRRSNFSSTRAMSCASRRAIAWNK